MATEFEDRGSHGREGQPTLQSLKATRDALIRGEQIPEGAFERCLDAYVRLLPRASTEEEETALNDCLVEIALRVPNAEQILERKADAGPKIEYRSFGGTGGPNTPHYVAPGQDMSSSYLSCLLGFVREERQLRTADELRGKLPPVE